MTILVNGYETNHLSVTDRGLQYGDGLFESIAIHNGLPLLWERHLSRLVVGCRRLLIPAPEGETLYRDVLRVGQGARRAVVKVIVTRGTSERGYRPGNETATTRIVGCYPWPDFPADNPVVGVRVRWCRLRQSRQPLLAGLKHLNRLEQVLARAEWQDEYVEGLMCDDQGQVIEGTMSNLFLVNDGTLITPDLSESGVAGVMRAEVLAQAEKLGMTTKVLPVTPSMVETAEELFLTNSLIGIWPITRLETKAHVVGKITKTLQSALQDANITA